MEIFLKVVDKIIALIKARDENKAKLFNEIVEPLHTEFEKVVVQYFSFFRSTLATLSDEPNEDIIRELKAQRNDYIQARIKIVSMAEAIKEDLGNADVLEYCNAIKSFFFVEPGYSLQTASSKMLDSPQMRDLLEYAQREAAYTSRGSELLRMLEKLFRESKVGSHESVQEEILLYVEHALDTMERSWSKASSVYAKLRVNYLLAQRL